MENSPDGRLFTLGGINGGPRQVITDPQEPFEAGVARGESGWDLPYPDSPEETPRSPSFWKYLLWPFSSVREVWRTYKENLQKNMNQQPQQPQAPAMGGPGGM